MIVRAFDGTRREVIEEIELPIEIGPYTFEILFQVMDISPAYSCLLGRPWIHSAGAVPSTLHQKLKFNVDNSLVIIYGEEDILVSKPSSTPYIEAAEEALETSFQALEVAEVTYVGGRAEILKPQLSKASVMTAKIMLENGYQYEDEQDFAKPLQVHEKKDRFGLGYEPTKADKRRNVEERKEKRVARLQNREPKTERIPICDIQQSFRSAGFVFADQVAVVGDDCFTDNDIDLVYPCSPGTRLNNWEIVEFPVIYDSCSK